MEMACQSELAFRGPPTTATHTPVTQRKQPVTFVSAEPEMGVYTAYTCNAGGAKPIYVTLELDGKPVVMQLDTAKH